MRRTTAALLLALALASSAQADDQQLVQGVIGSQIDSFRSGEHGQAFGHAAASIQLMFRNQENFARMVQQGYAPIYGAQNYRFGRSKAGEGGTLYQEVLLTGPNGKSWVALYTMARDKDGVWKIAGVRLVPGNEVAT